LRLPDVADELVEAFEAEVDDIPSAD